ncbi:MAG: hypothetical protein GY943_07555 [Chloroflexi bacterium]|nr:hypothetical protein [Chloroflexota bacterium]
MNDCGGTAVTPHPITLEILTKRPFPPTLPHSITPSLPCSQLAISLILRKLHAWTELIFAQTQ